MKNSTSRLLNLLSLLIVVSFSLFADASLTLVRRDRQTVSIMMNNSEAVAGAQMTVVASSSITISSVSASSSFSGSNWMFASNLLNQQELRVVVMGTTRTDLSAGSYEVARVTIDASDDNSQDFSLSLTQVVVSNGNGRSVTATGSSLTWNGQFDQTSPVGFSLAGNYPNPFNPSTTITFSIDRATDVHLAVYDILGREVKVLVNETRNAGTHQVTWNVEKGSVSTGSYFARLVVDGRSQVARMIVAQ